MDSILRSFSQMMNTALLLTVILAAVAIGNRFAAPVPDGAPRVATFSHPAI